MQGKSPTTIQFQFPKWVFSEENKMKALRSLSRKSSLLGFGGRWIAAVRLAEGNVCRRKCFGRENRFALDFHLFRSFFHRVPISLPPPREPREKVLGGSLSWRRLFMFLFASCITAITESTQFGRASSSDFLALFPRRKTWRLNETRTNLFSFPGKCKRRQTFLKSKPATRINFSFICFLFCLIWVFGAFVWKNYWFIIFVCKVFPLQLPALSCLKVVRARFNEARALIGLEVSSREKCGIWMLERLRNWRDLWSGKVSKTSQER